MSGSERTSRRAFFYSAAQVVAMFLLAGCTRRSSGGGRVSLHRTASSLVADIQRRRVPLYVDDAHMYVSIYPPERIEMARAVYDQRLLPGMEAGLVALSQRCTHLGCRVPFCMTSQWFECPCHRSMYNLAGEQRGGPAPRALDHLPVIVGADGAVSVDTNNVIQGPPAGVETTGQAPAGPHCVGSL
jgi:cytochrome b6-f complex iron-sulfur subunit